MAFTEIVQMVRDTFDLGKMAKHFDVTITDDTSSTTNAISGTSRPTAWTYARCSTGSKNASKRTC